MLCIGLYALNNANIGMNLTNAVERNNRQIHTIIMHVSVLPRQTCEHTHIRARVRTVARAHTRTHTHTHTHTHTYAHIDRCSSDSTIKTSLAHWLCQHSARFQAVLLFSMPDIIKRVERTQVSPNKKITLNWTQKHSSAFQISRDCVWLKQWWRNACGFGKMMGLYTVLVILRARQTSTDCFSVCRMKGYGQRPQNCL